MKAFGSHVVARACLWVLALSLALASGGCTVRPTPPPDVKEPAPQAGAPFAIDMDVMARSIAGISPGDTFDPEVVEMYGPGVPYGFQDQPDDCRYYTDAAHEVTLLVGWHTDAVVVVARLSEGTDLPPGVDPDATVAALSVPVAVDRGITLGMSPAEVETILGRPQDDQMSSRLRTFVYSSVAEEPAEEGYITYTATYEFESERLTSIEIYCGE